MKRVLPLRQRRAAVVGQLLSYPLLFIGHVLPINPLLNIFISLLAVTLWVASVGFLFYNTAIWHFGNAPDVQLDERQNVVRNYAYRNAYIALSTLVMSALLYCTMAMDNNWWLPSRSFQLTSLFFSFLFLMLLLPSAIIAWTEPEL